MSSLQVRMAWQGDLAGFARETHLKFARGARNAAEKQAARAKLAYRGAVRQSGLGDKIANAVRVDIYPKSASVHTHQPAVQVWTKAPAILYAFSTGVTIKNKEGLYLALPTENTPRKGRRLATPQEVESMFDQDLTLIRGRGGQMLGFIDRTLKGKLKRARIKGRSLDISARYDKLVLMFVFVRQATLQKRLNWDQITDDLTRGWRELWVSELAAALNG